MTISEAARHLGLTADTLRYYEKAGLLEGVTREASGHRSYGTAALTWATFITRLRATGMHIRQIRRYMDLYRAGDSTEAERLALLEEHRDAVRARIDETEANLALIETKIAAYKASGLHIRGQVERSAEPELVSARN